MRLTKHMALWVIVVAVVVATSGVAYRPAGAETSAQKDPPPSKAGDAEAALKKAMSEEARKVYEMDLARYRGGQAAGGEELYQWSVRWLEADLDFAADAAARTTALKAHLDRMKEVERMATNLATAGQGRESDAAAGRYYRTQAELWVARGRVK